MIKEKIKQIGEIYVQLTTREQLAILITSIKYILYFSKKEDQQTIIDEINKTIEKEMK